MDVTMSDHQQFWNQMAAAQFMGQGQRVDQLAAMQNLAMQQYGGSLARFRAMQNQNPLHMLGGAQFGVVQYKPPHVCMTSGCCATSLREVHSGTFATAVRMVGDDSTVSYAAPAKDKEWEQVKTRLLATNHVPRPWVSPLFLNKMRWNFDTPTRPWAAFYFTALAIAIFLVCL